MRCCKLFLYLMITFIATIVKVICYVDTNSFSLREIYETFDDMLDKVRYDVYERDPTLEFYAR